MTHKTCTICRQDLPYANFHVAYGKFPQGRCITCSKTYMRAYGKTLAVNEKCVTCGEERQIKRSSKNGKCRSCSVKGIPGYVRYKHPKGSKSPNWKGGITPIGLVVRGSETYRQWRMSILYRDDYTCQICHERSGQLQVDHYPRLFCNVLAAFLESETGHADDYADFWDTRNARTLCKKCHDKHGLNPTRFKEK